MKNKYLKNYFFVIAVLAWGCTSSTQKPKETISLKDALKDRFYIGAALNTMQFWEKDTDDVNIIKQHFNAIVPENCMKSMYIQPNEGEFNFVDADRFVEFGEQNGMWITGHCLIWHSQLPEWFCVDKNGENVTPEVLRARMKSHISTLAGRYKGRIHGWDVVNEAFLDDGSYRKSKFFEILGEEYLPLAFQYAHEADPDVELYYNDYGEWEHGKCQAIIRLFKQLKERGIRIDAVGMQGHIDMKEPDIDKYEESMLAFASEGIKMMITEFDLSILPSPWSVASADIDMNPYTESIPDDVLLAWTNRILDFFKLFIKYQDNVSRVTFWGVSDGVSWKNNFPVRGRTDYPLLFDRNHQAKTVVEEIIRLAD